MNSPGVGSSNGGGTSGTSGSSGTQAGGSQNQQGGGQDSLIITSIATPTSALGSMAIDTTTPKFTSSSSSKATPKASQISQSEASAGSVTRTIIISSVIGGIAFLLLLALIITLYITRRHTKKAIALAKARNAANLAIVPVGYTGANQAFGSGVPPVRPRRPSSTTMYLENTLSVADVSTDPYGNGRYSRASLASRRSGPSANVSGRPDSAVDLESTLHRGEGFLPPTYEESQDDIMSVRVLTPLFPLPSAFLGTNSGGLLSPALSPVASLRGFDSPYASSALFSPGNSSQPVFHNGGGEGNGGERYHGGMGEDQGYMGVDCREGGRYESSRRIEEEVPVSPLSPAESLEVPLPPLPLIIGGRREQGIREADSLENLVRGSGGLLGRSNSRRTVSSVSDVSIFSDGELREMNVNRGNGGIQREINDTHMI